MEISDALSNPILTFSIILIIALIIPEIIKRYKITAVPFFIIAGILIGPYGIGLHLGEGLLFLGEVGLLFLVFIAGLEIFEMGKIEIKHVILFATISALICFISGFLLGFGLGYSIMASFLLGTILISSSIGEIIPMVNSSPYVKKRLGKIIFPSIVILDAGSLILLGIIVKTEQPWYLLIIFIIELILLIVLTFLLLPKVLKSFFNRTSRKPKEGDLKFIITILMIVVALGYLIGVHGIVTAFIAGVIIGKFIPNQDVFNKIHGIGYGMMIPVFFIVLGMELEIDIIFKSVNNLIFPILLISTLILSKLAGGFIYSRIKRISMKEGLILGMVLWPQLSATIAASQIGYETGLFDQEILVSVVIMALFSALGTPFILRKFTKNEIKQIKIKDHIIIAGFGRTTTKVAYLLEKMNIPIVVIDQKHSQLKAIDDRGIITVYGNAASGHVLKEAGVKKAKMAILSVSDEHDLYICARLIRKFNPKCYIVAKVHTEKSYQDLIDEELVDDYIWPEKSSASEISCKVFDFLKTPKSGNKL
jgi:Kef-type K+ transport system membrane component KefB